MKLLGLHGTARCGKDTVAAFLEEYGFQSTAFARPLKDMLGALLQMNDTVLEEMKDKTLELGCTPRVLMQTLGTEWGRDIVGGLISPGESLWVRLMRERLDMHYRLGIDTVLTDVRFQDEADLIHELGGAVVHIYRNRTDMIATPDHKSEKGILFAAKGDYVLANHTTLKDLESRISVLVEMVEADQRS